MASSSPLDAMEDKTAENIDTHARLKQLYPAVKNTDTEIPSHWSQKDKHDFIVLSKNCLTVNYKGGSVLVIFVRRHHHHGDGSS